MKTFWISAAAFRRRCSITEVKELARLFSRVVDAKSPYTDEHSQRVARIARQLAVEFGLNGIELEQIEIAGRLHDIGKLRVSEDIIEKPGSLTPGERATMHRHSYDTFRILNRVFADSKIPIWAGFHHETLRGDGYRLTMTSVTVGSRSNGSMGPKPRISSAMSETETIAHLARKGEFFGSEASPQPIPRRDDAAVPRLPFRGVSGQCSGSNTPGWRSWTQDIIVC